MNTRGAVATGLLWLISIGSDSALAGLQDQVFRNGFEGGDLPPGAQISGRVLSDPNADGQLADGQPLAGVAVYLDSNYNGQRDEGEATQFSDADGRYRFAGLDLGLKHVRQVLEVPNVQTFPGVGMLPAADRLPDAVIDYEHAAPGVGDFDQPYGKLATEWPAEWNEPDNRPLPELLDSLDLVLKPLGARTRNAGAAVSKGAEALSLPTGARLAVRFDEALVDGPGDDLLLHTIRSGAVDEAALISVGPTLDQLTLLGTFSFVGAAGTLPLDFAGAISGPVHVVQIEALDNGGSWKGFEITSFEAVNIAVADPSAHVVNVTALDQQFDDRDFGRDYQDLPPQLTLGLTDLQPDTAGLLAGEPVRVQLDARDELGLASLELRANGALVGLDAQQSASFNLAGPGELRLQATATDSAGQSTAREAVYYVLNADGSDPLNPNAVGQSQASGPGAPALRILAPAPGESVPGDVELRATITGAPTLWRLDLAAVDAIDPYNLAAADPDYQTIASGAGNVFSAAIAIVPLASLPDGIYFLRLSAQNGAGQIGYIGQVIARNVAAADLRPQIVIESPASDSEISLSAEVRGSITSTRPLRDWFVEIAPAAAVDVQNPGSSVPPWQRLASGSATQPPGSLLGHVDATRIANGSYVLRVVARNAIGLGWVEARALEVTGEAKLGRNRVEFTDIDIELAGFPLRLTRVYDSLAADQVGDFGHGWSLQVQDTDIGETVPTTGSFGVFGATPFRVGARVYINAPDGRRLGFSFAPEAGTPSPVGLPYRVRFAADPGNYYRLEVPQGDTAFLSLRSDGTVVLFGSGFPYNPSTYVLVAPNGSRYTAHEEHGLLRAEDVNGHRLDFNSDGISHSAGARLQFQRDPQGRIVAIRDPEGNAWTYAYDAQGDLVSSTDPDLEATEYRYRSTPAHYLEAVIDPQGRMPRRFEYDPVDGRLIATIDEQGNRREALFDPLGFAGLLTDARGNETLLEYDQRGNVTRAFDPQGAVNEFLYADPNHPDLQTRFVDGEGGAWNYSYDAMGRVLRLDTPLVAGGNRRYDLEYDSLGNLTRFQDTENRTDLFTYDTSGNRLSETPAVGIAASFRYGPSGQLIERQTEVDFAVNYGYDANGLLASQSDPTGYQLELQNLGNGRLLRRRDNRGDVEIGYTPAGRLQSQVDDGGAAVTLTRNPDGSLTRTDRNLNATRILLDAQQRPVGIDLPEGQQVRNAFDADGNPASVTDPLGNRVEFTYGSTQLLEQIVDAAGAADTYQRDRNGNVTEIVDRNGRRRTFGWDANQRITHERWFDSGGALVREITFIYDPVRGLEQVDDSIGGVLHRITYFGTLPRPDRVDYQMPGQSVWSLRYVWSSSYAAPIDIRTGISNNDNRARIRVEPYGGRTARLDWQHPQSAVDNEVQLLRDPDGRIARIRRLTGSADGNAIADTLLGYDNLGRLTALRHQTPGGILLHPNAAIDYGWDAEARLLSETHAGDSVAYTHDGNGQLLSASHSAPAYPDEVYVYDAAGNRLSSHLAPQPATYLTGNRLASAGTETWQYDAAGNLIERIDTVSGRRTEFGYDHRNRLVSATSVPGGGGPPDFSLRLQYDYLDRLLYREIDGARTWLIHDREQPFAEFADGATDLSAAYLYDPDALDAMFAAWRDDALGERWLFTDQAGSVRGISNAAFGMQSWVDYDSFGRLQPGATPTLGEPLGFAGRPRIAALGLDENRRRFYAPDHGRFTQEDPTRFGGRDFNLYRYALNDPLGRRDPTGEVAAFNYYQALEELIFAAMQGKDGVESLQLPCQIASWSAGNFGYFEPLAEILRNPANATKPPKPDPATLLKLTGCNTQ